MAISVACRRSHIGCAKPAVGDSDAHHLASMSRVSGEALPFALRIESASGVCRAAIRGQAVGSRCNRSAAAVWGKRNLGCMVVVGLYKPGIPAPIPV